MCMKSTAKKRKAGAPIIFGIAKEAFFYIPGIDGSFYRVFLGAVLVAAALTNENIRKRIIGSI